MRFFCFLYCPRVSQTIQRLITFRTTCLRHITSPTVNVNFTLLQFFGHIFSSSYANKCNKLEIFSLFKFHYSSYQYSWISSFLSTVLSLSHHIVNVVTWMFSTFILIAAWVGSIAISVCFLFGFFSSLMCKKYGCGNIISIGGALLGIGLLLSSVVENIFMLAVTFGGVTSIGCSFLYFASLSVLPHYFKKYLCLATSFACCGISLSGVTFSPMIAYLIKMYGFQTCFQLFSITAVLPLLGGFIIQRYGTDFNYGDKVIKTKVKILDQSIFRNKKLLLVIFVMSLVELCYFTPYVHLVRNLFSLFPHIFSIDRSFINLAGNIWKYIMIKCRH